MRPFLLILLLIQSFDLHSQSAEINTFPIDTVKIYADPGVYDTQINKKGKYYLESKSLGYELVNVSSSGCDNSYDPSIIQNQIKGINRYEKYTTYTVSLTEYCCVSFLCEIEAKADTLNFITSLSPLTEKCECFCCYNLDFIVKSASSFSNYQLNGKPIELTNDKF